MSSKYLSTLRYIITCDLPYVPSSMQGCVFFGVEKNAGAHKACWRENSMRCSTCVFNTHYSEKLIEQIS